MGSSRDLRLHRALRQAAVWLEQPGGYRFAWTMPYNPHGYISRRWFHNHYGEETGNERFMYVAELVHVHGWDNWYYGRKYRALSLNGYFYWLMSDQLDITFGLNRKRMEYVSPYDAIAHRYDADVRTDKAMQDEQAVVGEVLDRLIEPGMRVLDAGCGAGWLLDRYADRIDPKQYVGIDPSELMLRQHAAKHPAYVNRLIRTPIYDFYPHQPFDLVAAVGGAGSYWTAEDLAKMPLLCDGRWVATTFNDLKGKDQRVYQKWRFTEEYQDCEDKWSDLADGNVQAAGAGSRLYQGTSEGLVDTAPPRMESLSDGGH